MAAYASDTANDIFKPDPAIGTVHRRPWVGPLHQTGQKAEDAELEPELQAAIRAQQAEEKRRRELAREKAESGAS